MAAAAGVVAGTVRIAAFQTAAISLVAPALSGLADRHRGCAWRSPRPSPTRRSTAPAPGPRPGGLRRVRLPATAPAARAHLRGAVHRAGTPGPARRPSGERPLPARAGRRGVGRRPSGHEPRTPAGHLLDGRRFPARHPAPGDGPARAARARRHRPRGHAPARPVPARPRPPSRCGTTPGSPGASSPSYETMAGRPALAAVRLRCARPSRSSPAHSVDTSTTRTTTSTSRSTCSTSLERCRSPPPPSR